MANPEEAGWLGGYHSAVAYHSCSYASTSLLACDSESHRVGRVFAPLMHPTAESPVKAAPEVLEKVQFPLLASSASEVTGSNSAARSRDDQDSVLWELHQSTVLLQVASRQHHVLCYFSGCTVVALQSRVCVRSRIAGDVSL